MVPQFDIAAMEALVRTYFDGCNEADIEKVVACFSPNAVHYFPPDMYGGPFVGARAIAESWARAVDTLARAGALTPSSAMRAEGSR